MSEADAQSSPTPGVLFPRLGSMLAIAPLGVWVSWHLWENLYAWRGDGAWSEDGTEPEEEGGPGGSQEKSVPWRPGWGRRGVLPPVWEPCVPGGWSDRTSSRAG